MRKYTNIFEAIWDNNIEAVKSFLPEQLESKDNFGLTPLYRTCCWSSNIEIILLLLDNGADIDTRDKENNTPLHETCIVKHYDISELLVTHGADPFAENNHGVSPLQFCYPDRLFDGIPHREILIQLREKYLNKQVLDKSECAGDLSSGWEMEM